MPGMRRREPGDLDVVSHQILGGREVAHLAVEVSLLGVPARSPAQHAADVEILADDLPHHVGWGDSLRRAFIMAATGRVDVVVAGKPVPLRKMRPAL